MFKSLKLKLTAQFLILSMLVYVVLTAVGVYIFHNGLTEALNEQLVELTTSLAAHVRYDSNSLHFREAPRPLRLATYYLAPVIQIYDTNKKLVASAGPKGKEQYLPEMNEVRYEDGSLLCRSQPIVRNQKTVGYLQIELSTAHRERAISEFIEAVMATAPLLILSFGVSGYYFASRAIKPVEETFNLLKRFIADAGHELKTPIAIIQATCENLAADLENNAEAQARLTVIERSTERMQKLVADLLLLTKAGEPRISQNISHLRLDSVVQEAVNELSGLFESKGVALYASAFPAAKLFGNKDSLYRMVTNLLENALHYTDAGGSVTVSLQANINNVVLKITDTGIGIPTDSVDKIFDRFYRVDESRARAIGGSGLGLSIVKAIVESHQATITVQSTPGKGSTFIVTFPVLGQTTFFRISERPPVSK